MGQTGSIWIALRASGAVRADVERYWRWMEDEETASKCVEWVPTKTTIKPNFMLKECILATKSGIDMAWSNTACWLTRPRMCEFVEGTTVQLED